MSSVSPLPTPPQSSSSAEKRVYEPSMEEILASIRRIIADDQSLPGRGAPSEAFASPLSPLARPAPEPVVEPAAAPDQTAPAAHGSVAAPQFASHPVSAAPERQEPEARSAHVEPAGLVAPTAPAAPETLAGVHVVHEAEVAEAYAAPELPQPAPAAPDVPQSILDEAFHLAAEEPVYEDIPLRDAEAAATDDEALYDAPIAPPEPEVMPVEANRVETHPGTPQAGATLFSAATDSSVTSAFNVLAASRLADNSDELMNLAREMIRPLLRTWLDDNLPSMVERMVRAEIERVARGGR